MTRRPVSIYALERRTNQRIEQVGFLVAVVAMIARDWLLIRVQGRRTR